jgi:hypothetical protein
MKKIYFIGLSILIATVCFAHTRLEGPYLGQAPPGDSFRSSSKFRNHETVLSYTCLK